MRSRLRLSFIAVMAAICFALVFTPFAHASTDKASTKGVSNSAHTNSSASVPLKSLKPNITGVIEIVLTDGSSRYRSVPFHQEYDNVDFVVNGTNVTVKYIVGYFLWFPIYSPPMAPGDYYTITGHKLYGAEVN